MTERTNPPSQPRLAPMLAPAVANVQPDRSSIHEASIEVAMATDAGGLGAEEVGENDVVTAEQLLAEHYDVVFRYAYRLTGDSNAAEDVVQEVFVRALKSCHQLRDPQAARGWLFVITRNEFARWIRRFAPTTPLSGDERCGNTTAAATAESVDWVQRSLLELPPEYRVVVTMFYFEQLSYLEIAAELQIPIGTVMSRLNRARKQLKDALIVSAEPEPQSTATQSCDSNGCESKRIERANREELNMEDET